MMITERMDSRFYKAEIYTQMKYNQSLKKKTKKTTTTIPGLFSPTWGIIALSSEMFILLYIASLVRFSCGIIICWKEILVTFSKEPFLTARHFLYHMCQNIYTVSYGFSRVWCGAELGGEKKKTSV